MSINPLKYRGIFDRPTIQSANLIDVPRDAKSGEPKVHASSDHVLRFMGWIGRGKRTRFSGKVSELSVLDQKAAWMSEWLRKGRYAREE